MNLRQSAIFSFSGSARERNALEALPVPNHRVRVTSMKRQAGPARQWAARQSVSTRFWRSVKSIAVLAMLGSAVTNNAFADDPPKPAESPKPPEVLMCVPLGGVAGQTTKLKARGLRLEGVTEVRSNLPAVTVKFLSQGKTAVPANLNANRTGDSQVEFELTLASEMSEQSAENCELTFVAPHGQATYRLPLSPTNRIVLEAEPNPGFQQSQKIELSQTVLGQIEKPFDVDVYSVELNAGQFVRVTVAAQKHGSAMDPLVALHDASNLRLLRNDDYDSQRDAQIEAHISKAGRYSIVVQDANDLGGEAQPYQLSIDVVQPPISFVGQVAPILQERCVACHGPRKAEGGYRLDSYDRLVAAGASGQLGFVAHSIDSSESFQRLVSSDARERMPFKGEPLAAEQIAILKRWVEEGLRFDGTNKNAPLLSQVPATQHPSAPESYSASLPITAIAYSPSSSELLVGGYHEISAWNPTDGRLLRRIGKVAERTYKIAMHPSGASFAIAGGNPGKLGEVRLFSIGGELQKVLTIGSDVVYDVAFSPDGDRIAVACTDATVRIYDVARGELLREVAGHLDWVMSVAWSVDGSKLATASRDKTAKVFDAHSGELLATYSRHDAQVRGVLFHPSGEKVYSSSVNQKLDLWKYAEAKHERDHNLGGEGFQLFSGGSFFLVPSSGNRVHAIRALEGDRIREFQASEPARFLCAAAHEASNLVAAGSQGGKVFVWEFSTGKTRIEFKAIPVYEVASVDKVDLR